MTHARAQRRLGWQGLPWSVQGSQLGTRGHKTPEEDWSKAVSRNVAITPRAWKGGQGGKPFLVLGVTALSAQTRQQTAHVRIRVCHMCNRTSQRAMSHPLTSTSTGSWSLAHHTRGRTLFPSISSPHACVYPPPPSYSNTQHPPANLPADTCKPCPHDSATCL